MRVKVVVTIGDDPATLLEEDLTGDAAERLQMELYAASSECGDCKRVWVACRCEDEP